MPMTLARFAWRTMMRLPRRLHARLPTGTREGCTKRRPMNCTPTPDRRARVPIHHIGVALGLMLAGTAHAAWDCPSLVAVTTADATVTSAAITNPPATIGGAAV